MRWLLLSFLVFPPLAHASPLPESVCVASSEMRKMLARNVGSERVAWGVRAPEEVMEVWKDARGDWAMVVRYANGTSCIVAMGESWEQTESQGAS